MSSMLSMSIQATSCTANMRQLAVLQICVHFFALRQPNSSSFQGWFKSLDRILLSGSPTPKIQLQMTKDRGELQCLPHGSKLTRVQDEGDRLTRAQDVG